jgi:hypothetical protein
LDFFGLFWGAKKRKPEDPKKVLAAADAGFARIPRHQQIDLE